MLIPSSLAIAAPSGSDIRDSMTMERGIEPCSEEDVDGGGKSVKLSGVRTPGRVRAAVRWSDARGEHLAVFWVRDTIQDQTECKVESRHLQVDVYDLARKPRLVRSVKEPAKACHHHSRVRFEDRIKVDDVDDDGIGELLFSYTIGCTKSDLDRAPRKLVVLEGKDKHILRGATRGTFKAEGFAKQPLLLEAAKSAWWEAPLPDGE